MNRTIISALLALSLSGCTEQHRAPARTGLEVSQCINAIAIEHLDRGETLASLQDVATLAGEIAAECSARLIGGTP